MGIHIRKAREDDLPLVQDIARRTVGKCYRSFLGKEGVDWYLSSGECNREVERHIGHCVVATENGNITGFSMFFDNILHWILVDVEHHRKGIGSELLSNTEQQLFAAGNDVIQLETIEGNANALAFYITNGWNVIRKQKDKTYDFMRNVLEKHSTRKNLRV
jgi:ribosomal protein S18 acetylase RimI-like enzyme